MSAEDQEITTDETDAPAAGEAVAEAPVAAAEVVASDAPAAEHSQEPAAEETAVEHSEEPVAEETAAEGTVAEGEPPGGAGAAEPVLEGAPGKEPVTEPATPAEAFGPVRVARVFVCERGHRTTTLWGEPDTCQARPLRSGPECGRPLYHITELPEQVQKALNPLKASKKGSKKK